MRCILFLTLLVAFLSNGDAEVVCPRITSEHNADVSELIRFRSYHKWRDKQGQDLAIAVWQYLCDRETGLYHMHPISDGVDPWSEYSTVRDPIKILNVYNVGFCGIFGPVMDGVFQGIGFESGRAFSLPKWAHTATEVWCDGRWCYFDLDIRGALRRPDGNIASLAEARQDAKLWVDPSRPIQPFFPKDHDKAKVFEIYRDSPVDNLYRWFEAGHTMDIRLRQGETLTRWWRPQGGRWHHLPDFNAGFIRGLLQREPIGYKSNHPEFSVWTQGNGLWEYQPDLTARSSDFLDGAESTVNVVPGQDGLTLAQRGEGSATFEVFTPWIIVPKVNDLDDFEDDSEASVVRFHNTIATSVLVSTDHGHNWQRVDEVAPGDHEIDLTPWVKGTYGYLVKFSASGDAGELMLRSLSLSTWVQVAPISLPRLGAGRNRCRYDIGDRYGRETRPMLVTPNVADPSDLKKYVVEMPGDYDIERKTARIRGDAVLQFKAPEGLLIDWLTVGACFSTHQGQAASRTDNRIAYSFSSDDDFQEIYRASVPQWVNHWRYQWDQDLMLDEPKPSVLVRYTGNPGLNVVRATLHLRPKHRPESSVVITHGYKVDGRQIEKTVVMERPGDYVVDVDGEPENEFIRLSVPSRFE